MKHRQPIAVTCYEFFKNITLREELLSRYQHVKFNEKNVVLSDEKLVEFLSGYKKAIIEDQVISQSLLEKLPDLHIISKFGSNVNNIDLKALREHKIRLYTTLDFNKRAIAELTIGLILNVLRHITPLENEMKGGHFEQVIGKQLSHRTIGIIGFGSIGQELAIILRNFGCRILAFDHANNFAFCAVHGISQMRLEPLLRTADIISIHLPLKKATRHLIDQKCLSLLQKNALLINTSSSQIVDEKALYSWLKTNPLANAVFDVAQKKENMDKKLLSLDNFAATPHIRAYTEETVLNMGRSAIIGLENAKIPGKKISH